MPLVPLDEVALLAVARPLPRSHLARRRSTWQQQRLERRHARVDVADDREGPRARGEVGSKESLGVVWAERRDVVGGALLAVERAGHLERRRWPSCWRARRARRRRGEVGERGGEGEAERLGRLGRTGRGVGRARSAARELGYRLGEQEVRKGSERRGTVGNLAPRSDKSTSCSSGVRLSCCALFWKGSQLASGGEECAGTSRARSGRVKRSRKGVSLVALRGAREPDALDAVEEAHGSRRQKRKNRDSIRRCTERHTTARPRARPDRPRRRRRRREPTATTQRKKDERAKEQVQKGAHPPRCAVQPPARDRAGRAKGSRGRTTHLGNEGAVRASSRSSRSAHGPAPEGARDRARPQFSLGWGCDLSLIATCKQCSSFERARQLGE